MKKLILIALFMAAFAPMVRAENSATAYDQKYYSQQVFVTAYNNSGATISNNNVVIVDASQAVNPNNYLGSYVTLNGSTTDSIFVFGVTDESIANGTLGRICVRGPHKVIMPTNSVYTSGSVIGACANSVGGGSGAGKACPTSTADGTASGQLGYILSATASTDNGDASSTYWAWIRPTNHK